MRRLAAVFIACFIVLWVAGANAQDELLYTDSLHLGLYTGLLSYESGSIKHEDYDSSIDYSILGLGIGSGGSFEVGYLMMSGLEFGGMLTLDYTSIDYENSDSTSTTNLLLAPYAKYLFLSDSSFVPYFGGFLGYSQMRDDDDNGSNTYGFGVMGGGLWVVAGNAALDLRVVLSYSLGHPVVDGDEQDNLDVSGFKILFSLGGSFYL